MPAASLTPTPDAAERPAAPASSPGATAWSERVGEWFGAAGAPHVLRVARPDDPAFQQALQASATTGVTHFECGFLPDEVPWLSARWTETTARFLRGYSYRPFVIAPARPSPRRDSVLFLTHGERRDPTAELAAQAFADATGWKLVRAALETATPELLSRHGGSAGVIINAVADRILGGAIDDFAARLGRPIVRFDAHGYSPLHFLFNQQPLPRAIDDPLRPWLVGALRRAMGPALPGVGLVTLEELRRCFGGTAHQTFWQGQSWDRLVPEARGETFAWRHRSLGWSAVSAWAESNAGLADEFGLDAWLARLSRTDVAQGVRFREAAMSRWIRRRPQAWGSLVAALREQQAAGSPVTDPERWLALAVRLSIGTDSEFFARLGSTAKSTARWSVALAEARAWALGDVQALPATMAETLAPWARTVCATAWARELVTRAGTLNTLLTARDFATRAKVLGGAAPVLAIAGGLRAARNDAARSPLRSLLAGNTGRPVRGLAAVVRAGIADERTWLSAVQSAAESDDAAEGFAVFAGTCAEAWMRAHRAELWRRTRSPRLGQELVAAASWLEAKRAAGAALEPATEGNLLLLQSLAGRREAALATARALRGDVDSVQRLRASAALACWLRDDVTTAAALLDLPAPAGELTAYTWYVRSVVALLAGRDAAADAGLIETYRRAKGFLTDRSARDPRFAWAAILARHGQLDTAAGALGRLALAADPGAANLLGDPVPIRSAALPERWAQVLRSFQPADRPPPGGAAR